MEAGLGGTWVAHRSGMRWIAILVIGASAVACGGVTDGGGDSGSGDSGNDAANDAPTFLCNGTPCSAYCIHPTTVQCPTCTVLPDGGTCPSGSTLENSCPAGPAMPPGQYCVSYPPVEPPYCSPTIPPSCWDPTPPSGTSGDVLCGPAACGA